MTHLRVGEAAHVVGVEVVDGRGRADGEVQQRRALAGARVQLDQVVDVLVDARALLVAAGGLGGDARQVQEGEHVGLVVVQRLRELRLRRRLHARHAALDLQHAAAQHLRDTARFSNFLFLIGLKGRRQ